MTTAKWILPTCLAAQLLYAAALVFESHRLGMPKWADAFYPIGSLMMPLAIAHSAFQCLRRGGIKWRGTRYSLSELRQAQNLDLQELMLIKLGLRKPRRL